MLAKREKIAAITAGVLVLVLGLDWYVATPFFDARERLAEERDKKTHELKSGGTLLKRSRDLNQKWDEVVKGGVKSDASEAESQLLNALRRWSQEANISISSIRPERPLKSQDLLQVGFQATGNGTMRAVSDLLFRLETTPLPIRIHELQVTSRTEGADDLTIQIRVSTICKPGESPADPSPRKPVTAAAPTGGAL